MNGWRIATYIALILAAGLALAAVWDTANWWRWLLTGAVVFLVGTGCSNVADGRDE